MNRSKKGFTLAELLIVVAIIAVLVAIAIPVFTTQLERSREGVDAANIRAAYAEVKAAALGGDTANLSKTVTIKQSQAGWVAEPDLPAEIKTEVTGLLSSDVPGSITVSIAGDDIEDAKVTVSK